MLVSVVTAVYNGEEYLQECMESILNQTFTEFEYMIVNDGSTDRTKKILDSIQDKRVTVIHLETNQGAAFCLNYGISQAKGKWIAIQDADDISEPKRLEAQVNYLKNNPQAIGVSSFVKTIAGKKFVSKEFLQAHEFYFNKVKSSEEVYTSRFLECYVCHGSVLFLKEAFQSVGGYNPLFKIVYDHDLWIRLFEIMPFEKIPMVLYRYRVVPSSLSHRDSAMLNKEVLLASTMGIRDSICHAKSYSLIKILNVIVAASQSKCEYFKSYIAPYVNIHVQKYISKTTSLRKREIYNLLNKDRIDAVFIMNDPKSRQFMQKLTHIGLKMDKHIFKIQ